MLSVRVWNLQSDCDAKASEFLETEFLRYRQLGDITIRTAGRSALRKCHRKGASLRDSLRKAIQHYLAQDDYIIFLVESDQQRQQKSSLLVDNLMRVVKDCDFSDRIFWALDIQEFEDSMSMQWQSIISHFHTEIENNRKQFRDEWDKTISHFHDAFSDTPEEEVIRDFEEALAEVRRERT